MGYQELIDSLHKEGEEKARSILNEAEVEAANIRQDASKKTGEMEQHYTRDLAAAVKEETEAILSEAGKKARMVLLAAEKELSDRLYKIAMKSLPLLREKRYPDLFVALYKELPQHQWRAVRVHPEDKGLAETCLPDAEVISDNSISGGLDVMTADERIRVTNTFDKRLACLWIEMLPGLMRDACGPEQGTL
ncbi:MAG TPA: V-type ATP synthase subunit E [Thermodesulfovibrionales bacterium]|nr:V-type ATP synthase subunit E [Thermodesulfovibrionales bacterium]